MENQLKTKMELAKELVQLIFSKPTPVEVDAKKVDVVAKPVTEPAETAPMGGPIGPQLKDATLQSGKKVQYNEPLTVGDPIFEIAEDGTQSPLGDGTIEINETPITVKDGKIESIADPGATDEEKPTKEGQPGQDEGQVTQQQFEKQIEPLIVNLKKELEDKFATRFEEIKLVYENKLKAALALPGANPIKQAPEPEEKKPVTRMDLIEKRVQLHKHAKHGQLFKMNEGI
jgi:hypothetical protein